MAAIVPGKTTPPKTIVAFQTLIRPRSPNSVAFRPQKRRPAGAAFSLSCTEPNLLEDDLHTAVLRLAHAVGGRDQRLGLALADDRDRRRRHAVAHQGVLDRVRTTQ